MPDILERLQAIVADRYKVERELGQGGMATVFLATDIRHGREVAIKVLNPELGATIGAERFEREIRLAAQLQHPNILSLYDSGSADGLLYYAMPFVSGESLRDRLNREGQLPVYDAVQLTLEVADALGYAHSKQIVHRDIKPENILLSNGHALVADFGIARAVTEGGSKLTQTGVSIGTPAYMSPEQATGETVGPNSDLYSLGCVLYEMLAGDPPFTGKNSMAIMARHALDTVPSVRIVRPSVPEEVEEAIYAAMEKSPADRPKTAADFTAILGMPLGATSSHRVTQRYTATRRIPSGGHRALERGPAWWRRPWIVATAVILVAGAAVAGRKLAVGGRFGGPRVATDSLARRVAVLYFSDNSKNGELRPVADALTESLIRSLSEVPVLRVVSRNGVARFRDSGILKDSVARALQAGTLVVGSLEPDGATHVRISTRLLDGTGTDLGLGKNVVVARDSLFAASDSVAGDVARALVKLLGQEIRLKESQAGSRNLAAWSLFNRAENVRKTAEQAAPTDSARAVTLFTQADSLLAQVQSADPTWVEPVILRAEVASQRGRLYARDPAERGRWIDAALTHVAHALDVDPSSAPALALRGSLRYAQYALRLTTDPVARQSQLDLAQKDLEDATQRDGSLATAYATLTNLYYDKKDVPMSLTRARQAYAADPFLVNTNRILDRLFWASYDTEQFGEAVRWCAEGARRFPSDLRFAMCRLWTQTIPNSTPDIGAAWRLAKAVDSLAPPNTRAYDSHLARLLVGGAIGRAARAAAEGSPRAALLDSARKVLVSARGDRTVDPRQELIGYEAVMRAQMGDAKEAVSLLKQYVAANPDHSFRVGSNVHWWWRELQGEPGFAAVLSRGQ